MAKSCWDCIFGGARIEEASSVHLNSYTHQAPPWPEAKYKNEKMFILPKILSTNDTVMITGTTFDQRERLSINLITGSESADRLNIACQLDIHFNDPVKISVQVVKNGQAKPVNDEKASTISFERSDDPLSFQVMFKVRSEEIMDIFVGPFKDIQKVQSVELQHHLKEIKFLTVLVHERRMYHYYVLYWHLRGTQRKEGKYFVSIGSSYKMLVKKKPKDGRRGEDPYNIQLNGNTIRAPPWPKPQLKNEKMFVLPKKLGVHDTIGIWGITFEQRQRLTISLITGFQSPDYLNVACQLDINFYDPNKILVQVIQNGYAETVNDEYAATDFFSDPQSFEVKFRVRSEEIVDVFVGTSHLESVELKHDINEIRFLIVHGDVERVSRLDFNFA
ncbi:unnamed protein product [Arctia plantaginis]|uniref:Galectin domain-containing protein n=1 Tax=Arctia plantaginis TaxID=874455 RepID=A0A8S0ZVR3_ARCPL|nr:unnamed protein product [Arctia plantaginis]